MNPSILFLGKANDPYVTRIADILDKDFDNLEMHFSNWGDALPEAIQDWSGDYIISYLSRWILPNTILRRAKKACINFHPGPPEYPGIGCYNFALYENSKTYGVTCHHMLEEVDSGPIIAVRRFNILKNDTVETLINKTYECQYKLFIDMISLIAKDQELPRLDEHWSRKAFTRKELNELAVITKGMTEHERNRRMRAINYKQWQTVIRD